MKNKIMELAGLFIKLGIIGFGGPAAHIAMMENEIVTKRKWITREHFLDMVGATNLIPGPNSTEMAMHCGHARAGIPGLFIAGACFIIPAVIITGIFALLYVKFGEFPKVKPFIYGIKPAVLAIIAQAILKLGKKAVKGWELALLGFFVLTGSLLGFSEIIILLFAGIIGTIYFYLKTRIKTGLNSLAPLPLIAGAGTSAVISKISAMTIFLIFLKVGSVLYGSGYVLFAYLDSELVAKGLMTRHDLMNAVAIGQFTPGPVLSTATFIGYILYGIKGALAATLGIFLPSFIFVMILNPFIPKMRKSKILSFFLDSVNIAAVAIMCAVLIEMGREILIFDWRAVIITLISTLVIFKFKKVSSFWIVLGASGLGYLLLLIRI